MPTLDTIRKMMINIPPRDRAKLAKLFAAWKLDPNVPALSEALKLALQYLVIRDCQHLTICSEMLWTEPLRLHEALEAQMSSDEITQFCLDALAAPKAKRLTPRQAERLYGEACR